jgi:small GTP-binding protein
MEEKEKGNMDEENLNIKRNLPESNTYDRSIKVIILGDSYVGKSSIINRLINNKFTDLPNTLSIEYHTYITSVNDFILRMQLWDTAGQEKFNSLISNYYKGTEVAIFVYSIDKEDSFKNVQRWFNNLKDNTEKSENILLGNKKDIIDEDESQRKVDTEIAEKFANDNKFLVFQEISCKNKDELEVENIYEVFDEIAKHYYNLWLEKKDKSISVNYVVSDSMMTLGKKHRNNQDDANNKKKKCCK